MQMVTMLFVALTIINTFEKIPLTLAEVLPDQEDIEFIKPYKPLNPPIHEKYRSNGIADSQSITSCGSCCYEIERASNYSSNLSTSFYYLSTSFYSKVINLNGFLVASSSVNSDQALYEAALTVAKMVKQRPDYLSILKKEGVHLAVIGENEDMTDIPAYSRGVRTTNARPVTPCAEENLLCLGYPTDSYYGENACLHEASHSLVGFGGSLPTRISVEYGDDSENLDETLKSLYEMNVVQKGLWKNTYAATNYEEYWAEGVQSYYSANMEGPIGGDGKHNDINTQSELKLYDKDLFKLIKRVFKAPDTSFECPSISCDCSMFDCDDLTLKSKKPKKKIQKEPKIARKEKNKSKKNEKKLKAEPTTKLSKKKKSKKSKEKIQKEPKKNKLRKKNNKSNENEKKLKDRKDKEGKKRKRRRRN